MVQKKRYLERMTFVSVEETVEVIYLEALFHKGDRAPGILIAPQHPRSGGSMDSPVAAEMAWALTRSGHPTLRFNYRGAGASRGLAGNTEDDLRDTLSAYRHLYESTGLPLSMCGIGHAGSVAACSAYPEVPGSGSIAFVEPPLSDSHFLAKFRNFILMDNAPEILLVLPDNDLKHELKRLPDCGPGISSGVHTEIIEGSGSGFMCGLKEAGKAVADFFTENTANY